MARLAIAVLLEARFFSQEQRIKDAGLVGHVNSVSFWLVHVAMARLAIAVLLEARFFSQEERIKDAELDRAWKRMKIMKLASWDVKFKLNLI